MLLRMRLFEEPTIEELVEEGEGYSPQADIDRYGADLGGLKWLAIYGLKGMGICRPCLILGHKDNEVNRFFLEAMSELLNEYHGRSMLAQSEDRRN